eukprot:Cvel_18524.t1-p1 / transcript=Cvel_18524.t1 / gene=Cvel_18524 / organism=Chromera_velia_CCMP2878 / gene_product=hypothetical protein / transcript_product=hypothetical protein / location=Cvel_scaffold1539:40134-44519(+) / protein_length=188 / sequence_SO=supercontig / SO=protein_coding / is_pseudo=false
MNHANVPSLRRSTWALSGKTRNRLAHVYNGNTTNFQSAEEKLRRMNPNYVLDDLPGIREDPLWSQFASGADLNIFELSALKNERCREAESSRATPRKTGEVVGGGGGDEAAVQKGKGKGNGGAADSAGGGAAPAGPSGRTNLKPKEAAADTNAEKARGKLPPPEKVITPGEEGYRPLYIHLQYKGLVV